MKIVFLDVKTIGEDIDLSYFDELGEVVKYSFRNRECRFQQVTLRPQKPTVNTNQK